MRLENPKRPSGLLDVVSLREQVYEYLRSEMHQRKLLPGSFIKINEISEKLGISTTPLRDAIIQLECEGFVTILPRRGVLVNKLSIQDVRNILEITGALESTVIQSVFDKFSPSHIAEMKRLNSEMILAINRDDFDTYYKLNITFHDVFLNLSENDTLKQIIMPLKQRLYDFPRRTYIKEWELINRQEHDQLVEHIEKGEREQAARLMRDSHWSFEAYETFIRRFYADSDERIESELAWHK
ncbi:MAG: GntR family transcriptional regulator [Chloroflexi bacterium]|jgi:DNA-binding GntR family transcriptional regulator|nr:GntR family transcriptional regulator [Chloroflexota bacterium]